MSDRFQQQLQTSLYFLMLIVIPTLGTLTALYLAFLGQITWLDIILCISMVILTELGITVGFHRMLVHQSFIAHPIVKFILLFLTLNCLWMIQAPWLFSR